MSFGELWITAAYVAVMILLGFHLRHGVWSAFQSLGWNNTKTMPLVEGLGLAFAVVLVLIGALVFVYYRMVKRLKRMTLSTEGLIIIWNIVVMMLADVFYDGAHLAQRTRPESYHEREHDHGQRCTDTIDSGKHDSRVVTHGHWEQAPEEQRRRHRTKRQRKSHAQEKRPPHPPFPRALFESRAYPRTTPAELQEIE